ncbi:hypothetical protein EH223_07135 [candidate division KSB1 bacterium]|nr:MAG: hypothetical protein EH223_07135 [candidate division KSB1 bacterium]
MEDKMNDDVGHILKRWKYNPNDINVRLIFGQDGKEKLQMRIDLGLLQMELDGRPDGRRPHRFDSYLSFFETRAQQTTLAGQEFKLKPDDCLHLQQESIQYYHRYLALMRLGDFARVVRDTQRNMRVFDFVAKHAPSEDIMWSFQQYRAYVLMMHTRARAALSLEQENFDEALRFIKIGIRDIQKFFKRYEEKLGEEPIEIDFLKQWLQEIKGKKPVPEHERLAQELEIAVQNEDYEKAVILRDRLRTMNRG